eukprot:c4088_g1_i1.p1 GENE.c4088_g1_i1~~c4088_g1_i1.p1  ORF type:complete len:217 (-),score=52.90 c4088_g1_i1:63-668(-)
MVVLRCTGEDFSDRSPIATDVANMNSFTEDAFNASVKLVIDFMIQPQGRDLMAEVEALGEANQVKLGTLKNSVRTLILLLRGATTRQLSSDQLSTDLSTIGLETTRSAFVVEMFVKHANSIAASVVDQTVSVNELVDMEWKFGVTASNGELNKVGNTFLQMKLAVDKGDHNENVYAELSLPQFYSFLAEMERANAALAELS